MEKPNFTNVENFDDGLTRVAPLSWWDFKEKELKRLIGKFGHAGYEIQQGMFNECKQQHEKEMQNYVKIEDVDSLFRNIRLMILDMDEDLHNWNKNNVAGTVYNSYLFFKKTLVQKEKTE